MFWRCCAGKNRYRGYQGAAASARRRWVAGGVIASGKQELGSGKRRQPGEQGRLERLEAAVAERDRVIGELTIANRLLKKNGFQGS